MRRERAVSAVKDSCPSPVMEPSHEQIDDISSHRPLPSVGMPLLRNERRSARNRRFALVAVALFLSITAVAALVAWPASKSAHRAETSPVVPPEVGYSPPRDAGAAPSAAAPEAPAEAPPPLEIQPLEEPGSRRITQRFGQTIGFRPALRNVGFGDEDADAIIEALRDVMDFRRCRPEHTLVLESDATGSPIRFEYRASLTQVYEAIRDGSRWLGRQVEIPVARNRIEAAGTVASSLGAALEEAGLGRAMVGVFVETFDKQINFNTETRAGDAFRLLVDEERIGGEFLRYGTVWALEYRSQRRGAMRAYWFEPRGQTGDFYDEEGRAVHGGWLRTPLRYDHISSPYNPRRMHPVLRRIMPHTGIDYAAGTGTPVWAAASGTVAFIGPRGANGNLVMLQHDGGYETAYAHLSRFASGLHRGDHVEQRQLIGYVGTTGRSTGPHLHFGLKRHGHFIDPAEVLNGPGRMLPPGQMGAYRTHLARLRRALSAVPVPEIAVPEPSAAGIEESVRTDDEVMD